MPDLSRYGQLLNQPPHVVARKLGRRIYSATRNALERRRDRIQSTYAAALPQNETIPLARYFHAPNLSHARSIPLALLTDHYLAHRFDLLGSGWTEVRHGMTCLGLEGHLHQSERPVRPDREGEWLTGRINPANLDEAKMIWRLVGEDYQPIDWHLDFKSGYRWQEDCWFRDIAFGQGQGIDIKVPWELSRMQHLPQLALAYGCALEKEVGFSSPERYVTEFRNQIIDFIANNPPRYGVNWACAMEVAIRTVNWLVAYDLFRSFGAVFDDAFEQLLGSSIQAHGSHIAANLEWIDGVRGNHYLADIVGLLYSAAYLPNSPETDAWLSFSVRELICEVGSQFQEDGSSFEASTAYHRLSAEIAVYGTALTLALPQEKKAALQNLDRRYIRSGPKPRQYVEIYSRWKEQDSNPFTNSHWRRLLRMAEFTIDITGPNGEVVQIGDNDSGRLLKLCPSYDTITTAEACARFGNLSHYRGLPDDATYLLETPLDHRHLVSAINGFFWREDFKRYAEGASLETEIIQSLSGGSTWRDGILASEPRAATVRIADTTMVDASLIETRRWSFPATARDSKDQLRDRLQCRGYPDFGLYLYRSSKLFLAIRCGPIGLNGLGAHAHNDQLSIELWLDGKPIIRDPGTYVYTPLPNRRNVFRSATAHFAPHLAGIEPGDLTQNIFALGNEAQAECLHFDDTKFLGRYRTKHGYIYRKLTVDDYEIVIEDWTTDNRSELAPLTLLNIGYSRGYGWIEPPT